MLEETIPAGLRARDRVRSWIVAEVFGGAPAGRRPPARRLALVVGLGALLASATGAAAQRPEPPPDARYVASRAGQVYYWVGCSAWRRLAPQNIIFFRDRAGAEAAAYRPSRTGGCEPRDSLPSGFATPRPATAAAVPFEPLSRRGAVPDGVVCTILYVTDGDTLRCRERGERVRLLLIDTPELDQRPYGPRAKSLLEAMLPEGTRAVLELDVQERDRYGRVLAYAYTRDGLMVNEEMARRGYAVVLVYPPNVRYVERVRSAAGEARRLGRGFWSTPAFDCAPIDHRAGRCETVRPQ